MQCSLFEAGFDSGPEPELVVSRAFRSTFETPLGWMQAVSDGDRLMTLVFGGEGLGEQVEDEVGSRVKIEILEYFDGVRTEFSVPLGLVGTPFQVRVWRGLIEIGYGSTVCYSELALKLGVKNGQRAVGMANRVNPIAVIVPCHRVIQADGQLCGYAGGLWRKQQLLGLESGQRGLF